MRDDVVGIPRDELEKLHNLRDENARLESQLLRKNVVIKYCKLKNICEAIKRM